MRILALIAVLVGLAIQLNVEVEGLAIEKSRSPMSSWQSSSIRTVELPNFMKVDPKYRVDCNPDIDEYRSFCVLNLSKNSTLTTSDESCTSRGCTRDTNVESGIPTCYIPTEKGGYSVTDGPTQLSSAMTQYTLTRLSTKPAHFRSSFINPSSAARATQFSMFGHDIENLKVQVSVSGPQMIRMTIRNADSQRYEVPVPIRWNPSAPTTSGPAKIKFEMTKTTNQQVGFRVKRTDSGSILFDTTLFANGFIYDDQFLQIITTIPSRNAYGFGENTHPSFRHELNKSNRYGIFARDQPPQGFNENLYGTHPFYMVIEPNGEAFGVFIFNSNAQDYKFDEFGEDKAMFTYRTIGGILDVFVFSGPTPELVIRQYQSIIGNPYLPPYWAFGFQLCRYGYDKLDNMKAAMFRTLNASIPIDVHYGDIDYFRKRLDFTWNTEDFNGLPEYIDWLHEKGMKFITILDPAIDSDEKDYSVFDEGQKADIWIKWPARKNVQFNETGNRNMLGYVWPDGKAVFPDFFYPPAFDWWKSQIVDYHKQLKFDGIWIDMNEPANFDTNKLQPWNWNTTVFRPNSWNLFCNDSDEHLDNPPYKTAICGDYISDKTLCMIAEQTDGRGKIYTHYDVHNLYGWSETIATLPAARSIENKRSVVISRSTFPTSGSFTGHWLGDNTADWRHLKYNIIGMLEFNLFGIPYIGADICGFFHNTTEQMCQRWMQLGSFNPFFRNHNGNDQDGIKFIEQDPGIFSPDVVASNRRAVEQRYTLIPYLYSLFFRVHISGGTVVRSMAHVFPTIPECWPLDEQFLWGSSLLIAPVIKENHTTKSVYLPWTERWFNYYTGEEMKALNETTVAAPYDFLPLFLRGGSIIPHQQSAMNTVESRKKPLYLIVALDKNQQATGELFWDDGESIDTYNRGMYNHFNFVFKSNGLTIEPWTYKYPEMGDTIKLEDIKVFGMNIIPTRVLWNGQELKPAAQWTFNNATNILQMTGFALNVAKIHKFTFL
ncbi:unnamed protein product [Rotaria magnacalcarata]|uniref:Maltase n=5 Tax=Rotaria magnacalcarata TaxID=392030 RepID=A0A816PIA5_9BILA|nr:unnamed protein product [Rotaria magnacalcarata]CAF4004936.1 unnamed protein product [Rotaria magnacalcarata]